MRCQKQQRWTNAFAAAFAQVLCDLGDCAYAGGGVAAKLLLNGHEVFSQQFENLSRRRYRQGAQRSLYLAFLICAVVRELQIDAEVAAPKGGNDGLKIVAILAGYS